MASKKVNIFTLSALIAMMTLFGCKDNKNDKTSEPQKDPRLTQWEWGREDMERYNFINNVTDSCLQAQGVEPVISERLPYLRDSISYIDFQNSANGALAKAVNDAGTKIMDRYVNKLCKKLDAYKLAYKKSSIKSVLHESSLTMYGVNADYGTITDSVYDKENARSIAQYILEFCIDLDSLGAQERLSVEGWVNNLIVCDMCNELYKSRKSIEKQYAQYFAGGMKHINKIGVSGYGEVWDGEFGQFVEVDNWVTERRISVYAPNLPHDFCADTNAKYKLEQVGNSQWCVIKKLPNGKLVKSDTFKDDVVFDTIMRPDLKYMRTNNDYFALWGHDTIGGVIDYSEVIKIEKPRVKYPKNAELSRQSAKLNKRYDKLYDKKQAYDSCRYEAEQFAIQQWNARHNKGNCR